MHLKSDRGESERLKGHSILSRDSLIFLMIDTLKKINEKKSIF